MQIGLLIKRDMEFEVEITFRGKASLESERVKNELSKNNRYEIQDNYELGFVLDGKLHC